MKRLEKEWANSQRSGLPLSVVMFDLDNFKFVNDTHGHGVGDVVLQATARAIRRVLRRGDTCARMGGEEFLVICPNTNQEGAVQAAERIRFAIESNGIQTSGFVGQVTASAGIGVRSESVSSIDELLKIADEAVYEAKRAGRNRTVIGRSPGQEKKSA